MENRARQTATKKSPVRKTEDARKGSKDLPLRELKIGKTKVVILGTAHVSRKSVEDVERLFRKHQPDTVCVELCDSRYQSLRDPDRWKKLDLGRVIKDGKLGLLASSLILSAFQKKIGETTGAKPGDEMVRAADLAVAGGARLVLADREVRVTLSRAWREVGLWSKMWLASNLFASLLVSEEIEEEEIERLKQEDVLVELFTALPPRYQGVREIIIDERDRYLAGRILQAAKGEAPVTTAEESGRKKRAAKETGPAKTVLAVIGAGHLQGVVRTIEEETKVDFAALDHVPPVRKWRTVLTFLGFSAVILAVSALVTMRTVDVTNLALTLLVSRALGAGIGTLLAGAHPVTILTTAALAPISLVISLFTGTRLWMFSALVELRFRKPRVEDFEGIAADTEAGLFKSLYKNRVLHLFWVITGSSIGLTIGNLSFFGNLIARFFGGH